MLAVNTDVAVTKTKLAKQLLKCLSTYQWGQNCDQQLDQHRYPARQIVVAVAWIPYEFSQRTRGSTVTCLLLASKIVINARVDFDVRLRRQIHPK